MRFPILAAALALITVVGATSADAATKTLILGDDIAAQNAAILIDLTGSDSRFDHTGSSSYSLRSGLIPTASFLSGFDSVLLFTNYASVNYTALSNVLGDYVNHGGGVVISTFWGQEGGLAGGLLNSHGYNPLINPINAAYDSQTLGTYNAADPLFAGVSSLTSSYFNGDYLPGLDGGATLAGSWASGKPLAAYNAAHTVAAITLFPNVGYYGHASGDYRPLFANALAFVAGQGVAAVPEPATWGMMIVGFGMIGTAARRKKAAVAA